MGTYGDANTSIACVSLHPWCSDPFPGVTAQHNQCPVKNPQQFVRLKRTKNTAWCVAARQTLVRALHQHRSPVCRDSVDGWRSGARDDPDSSLGMQWERQQAQAGRRENLVRCKEKKIQSGCLTSRWAAQGGRRAPVLGGIKGLAWRWARPWTTCSASAVGLLWAGDWTRWPPKVFPKLNYSTNIIPETSEVIPLFPCCIPKLITNSYKKCNPRLLWVTFCFTQLAPSPEKDENERTKHFAFTHLKTTKMKSKTQSFCSSFYTHAAVRGLALSLHPFLTLSCQAILQNAIRLPRGDTHAY